MRRGDKRQREKRRGDKILGIRDRKIRKRQGIKSRGDKRQRVKKQGEER